jgi:purine-binding chemotaxis protein CheW
MEELKQNDNWDSIREALKRAAEAIASTQANFEEREVSALISRTKELARALGDPITSAQSIEVLIFNLGAESFAIETKYVHEVIRRPRITACPSTPEFLLGVINLRGEILAVFDLNQLFGVDLQVNQDIARLIVIGQKHPEFGLIADAVEQVEILDSSELPSPAAPLGSIKRELVCGVSGDALILLNGHALLNDERLIIDHRDARLALKTKAAR